MRTADQRSLPLAYRFVVSVVRPLLRLLTKQDWRGMENIPATGGVILASNHLDAGSDR